MESVNQHQKSINISARISAQDAEFLASYRISDAVTPSDKLRALIAQARRSHEQMGDYRGAIEHFRQYLIPIEMQIRELELDGHMHSELVMRTLDWLPEFIAFVVASGGRLEQTTTEKGQQTNLPELEDDVADRVFRLFEAVLQMSFNSTSACYNGDAISNRLGNLTDLFAVVSTRNKETSI